MISSELFLTSLNQIALIDVGFKVAYSKQCKLSKLPESIDQILPLIKKEHADIISDLIQGEPIIQHDITDYSPIERITYFDEKALTIEQVDNLSAFFKGRPVSIAKGMGQTVDEPYGFSFDWFIVLDSENQTIYSFIFNLQD